MGAFPPPPPPSATEFVVFALHLKRLIKSLTLGAEQGLVIFLHCAALIGPATVQGTVRLELLS